MVTYVAYRLCPPVPSLVWPPKGCNVYNCPPSDQTPSLPTSPVHKQDTSEEKRKSPHTPQEGLLNLSKHELSPAEISLLKKGLSFVPSPLKIPQLNYKNALEKLRWKHKNKFSLPNRSQRLIDCSFEAIGYDLSNTEIVQPVPNLTRAERLALHRLEKIENLIITKADKGDTTVIMDTSHLVELAHKHLSDVNTYRLLKNDPTPEVVVRFNQYILDCLHRRVISQKEYDRLLLPEDSSTQTMYFLPKIHKCPLKVRPIVSCTNSPTSKASAFLDKLLQPHMKSTTSNLKNSTQLVNILADKRLSTNSYLVTLDIESLYTNISHDQAIVTFLRIFKNHPQVVFLLDLLKFVLKNNIFEFDNLIFTQICGLAMGTKLALGLATIYIGHLEENFLMGRKLRPELWLRYIDDIFMVWAHPLNELHAFLSEINNIDKKITFTAEISQQDCNFLDLTIYKSPSFEKTDLLSTSIYYQPTNTFSFPLNTSYIPMHIHKGIAIGEMTRVIRNTTSPTIRKKYRRKLVKHFMRRGYDKRILKRVWNIKHAERETMLRPKKKTPLWERPNPLCIEFAKCRPTVQKILTHRWRIMHNDFRLLTLFPDSPAPVFTSRPKLKSILSKKRSKFDIPPSDTNLTLDKLRSLSFLSLITLDPLPLPSRYYVVYNKKMYFSPLPFLEVTVWTLCTFR